MALFIRTPALSCITLACLFLADCSGRSVPDESSSLSSDSSVENRGSKTEKWWEKLPRSDWASYERVLPEVDWFEVYRVAPATFAIYEPGQFEEVISFLIVGHKKAILFDTGLGLVPLRPVINQLTDKELIVLNSHSHYDHVGGNHEFASITTTGREWTKVRSNGMSNNQVGEFVKGDWLPKPPYGSFDPSTYEVRPWVLGDIIEDGTMIELGERQIIVLETPGHAPDSICLFDKENRLLFMGDTFYLAPLYAHLEGSDFETYKATVDRLALFEPKVDHLMTAHNVPKVNAGYLGKLEDAFQVVSDKAAAPIESDGALEYQFDGFSILVEAE